MINKYRLVYTLLLLAFWPAAVVGFLAEELLPFLQGARPIIYLAADMIVMLTGFALMHDRRDKIICYSFLAIGLFSTFFNHEGAFAFVNGMRDFVGMIFVLPIMRFLLQTRHHDEFTRKIDRQLYIYLFIQALCITVQFMRYGANDHGGGSWGFGSSGLVSVSIYFISFYLMTRRWNDNLNLGANLCRNWILVFLLYPTFLNETKASFVFLICYFALLMEMNKAYILKLLLITPVMAVFIAAAVHFYLLATDYTYEQVFSSEAMDEYLTGGESDEEILDMMLKVQDNPDLIENNQWVQDLPRFMKINLLDNVLSTTRGGIIFGAGLGQMKGGTIVEQSQFAQEYSWYIGGTRPYMMFIIVQIGIVGFLWFLMTMYFDIAPGKKFYGKFSLNIKTYFLLVITMFMFYSDALRSMPFCIILFYILARVVVKPYGYDEKNDEQQKTIPDNG